jgi:hypothetical protein
MHQSRQLLTAVCTTLTLLSSACVPFSSVTIGNGNQHSIHPDRNRHNDPPPHAPAHGYRHKHQHQDRDLQLVFDSDLGVYIVVGMPNRYYWDGHYLRIDGDQWYASMNFDRGWELRSDASLPSGMRKHKKHRDTKRGKSKKSNPAKGYW